MAKKESERVMQIRRRECDRISFTAPKGTKYLFRAQALREGVSSAEMMRRAILARCGLESVPSFSMPHYHAIVTATDKDSADRAIEGLQLDEYVQHHKKASSEDDICMTVLLSSQEMKNEYIKALLDLLDALEDTDAPTGDEIAPPSQIKMTKENLAIVRRLLSNIEIISQCDPPANDDDGIL